METENSTRKEGRLMDQRIIPGDTIQIDNDMWDHLNKDYRVHNVFYRDPSTAVELTLEDAIGTIFTTVVARNQIVKVI